MGREITHFGFHAGHSRVTYRGALVCLSSFGYGGGSLLFRAEGLPSVMVCTFGSSAVVNARDAPPFCPAPVCAYVAVDLDSQYAVVLGFAFASVDRRAPSPGK